MKKLLVFLLIVIGGAAYYQFVRARRKSQASGEVAYVLPEKLPVLDTTAIIHRVIATLHGGEQVIVSARIGEWARLQLPHGQSGWVPQESLIDRETYKRGQELLKDLTRSQVQAEGHTDSAVNLHLEPSRDALKLAEFPAGQRVDVYNRRLVARSSQPAPANGKEPPPRDVWYLVRSGPYAGWILGRFVDLDVPAGLANYAQGINMVAWLVLDTVDDGGHEVPQYLAADRIGERDLDFNHIRVFTWWIKHHKYVTAYVESHLNGYFPITVTHEGNVPYFRLRLIGDQGEKYQKVYGLFDTIVRPIGTVEGWTSEAMPAPPASRARRRRARRRR